MDALRAVVVMDYQNVHLTARDVFDPNGDPAFSLIHPVAFAQRALHERNIRQRDGFSKAVLQRVHVFRGLPHANYDPNQNRRCLAQARQWRQDGALVTLRDLKYRFHRGADGRPIEDANGLKRPTGRGQEKGIDVLVALTCVREARLDDVDVVVLATRDTDLVPVLDEVIALREVDSASAHIETVAWFDREGRTFGNLRPASGRRIWNTNLDRLAYEASIDRNKYL